MALRAVDCAQRGEAGSFRWFCRSTSLQELYNKTVPQFVFRTHPLSGKVRLQYLLGPAGGTSWHQPARSMLELQSCHQQRGPPASCCSSSEICGRLRPLTRANLAPAGQAPQSRSDTAPLPTRGVCGNPMASHPDLPSSSQPRGLSGCSFDPEKPQLDRACPSLSPPALEISS